MICSVQEVAAESLDAVGPRVCHILIEHALKLLLVKDQ